MKSIHTRILSARSIFVLFFIAISTGAIAQMSNINTALIRLNNKDLKDAKKYIDMAYASEETKDHPKMWVTRGDVYYALVTDTNEDGIAARIMDKDLAYKSLESYINALKSGEKKYHDQAILGGIGVAAIVYNESVGAIKDKNYDMALRNYTKILEFFPYDKKEEMKKSGLSENDITKNAGLVAYYKKDWEAVKKYMSALAEKNFLDPDVYIVLAKTYEELGDTATAIKYVEQGRGLKNDNEDLINEELYLYSRTNQADKLISKLSAAIETDPSNPKYYYFRGTTYEGLYKQDNKHTEYLDKAEADYKKAIEMEPGHFESNFALGILYFNKAVPVINERENTDNVKQKQKFDELDAKAKDLLNTAAKYYEAALATNDKDLDLLTYAKLCYAQLQNMEKVSELGKKIKALEGK
jgi:tetratricopeptide (TPR) repeat protein